MFTYEDYKCFINHMKYISKITSLGEWDNSNAIILRHDVDLDLDCAYKLALIEFKEDITSTFFILTSSATYNPLSKSNREYIKKVSDMGFEIGLHFDPILYGDILCEEMIEKVNREASILTSITEKPIKSISLHNPSIHGKYPLFEGYKNAYDPNIFSNDYYMSDSQRNFRGKNPYDFVRKALNHPIQILLHPCHFAPNVITYGEIFFKHLYRYMDEIDTIYKVNSSYRSVIKGKLFNYILDTSTEEFKTLGDAF